jgi:subtilisin family serine protease
MCTSSRAKALWNLLVIALVGAWSTQVFAAEFEAVPGEILVKLRPGTSPGELAQIHEDSNAEGDQQLANVDGGEIHKLRVRGSEADALLKLNRNPSVEYAELNYILQAVRTPNDPRYGDLWGMVMISAESAWDITTGDPNVVVGVVDTGIDYTHPDLAANVWSNPGGIGGCPAGTHGYNAITRTCDPRDDNNHGSHCSGTIGGVGNNGIGVAGVNWAVRVMGLKFLDAAGSGSTADAISALEFAINAKLAGVNLRVLSNSWGGGAFSQSLLDEINKAGGNDILFVAAAGNSNLNIDVNPTYPASYNTANLIAVAATDSDDQRSSFSNYGANSVHLGAPGVSILSTVIGGYSFFSGTSMATPHVAGVAALVLAARPGLSTANLKSAILDSVDPNPDLAGITVTGGRLNAAKAVGTTPPPAGFSLSASPSSATEAPGGSTTYTVTISRTSFSDAVGLSASGQPSGSSATFNPASTTGTSSTLTVATAAGTPVGPYSITITGTSGTLSRNTSVTLQVSSAPPPCDQGDCQQ